MLARLLRSSASAVLSARDRVRRQLQPDTDDDGIVDAQDCPHAANHSQTDRDADGLGDKCDPRPNTKTFTMAGQSVGRQPSQSEHSAVTMRNGQFVMTGELSR